MSDSPPGAQAEAPSSRALREQALNALRESEARYQQILDNAGDVIYITDANGNFVYVNPPATRLTGYSEDELLNMHFTDLISPEHHRPVQAFYVQQAANQVRETLLDFPIITRDGTRKWVEQVVTLVASGEELRGFQSVVRDITQRKALEEAEREQRALAEALADTAAAISSSLELDEVLDRILANVGRVVKHDMANVMLLDGGVARLVRMRGYEDWGVDEVNLGMELSATETPSLRQMIAGGQPVVIADAQADPEWIAVAQATWLRSYMGAPIRLEGEVIGVLNVDSMFDNVFTPADAAKLQAFADQAAIALRNAQLYAEVQQRNAELDAFSHMVAHNLKSPLQMVIAFIGILRRQVIELIGPEVRDMMETVSARTFQMSGIIDSLLLFSTLRDASTQISLVEIPPIVEGALARFEGRIAEQGFAVEVGELPPALGYGPWIEEVFANLISNAVKYIGKDNPAPRLAIRGWREGDAVRYEVEDNGLGIQPEDQARLFEMFSRFHVGEEQGFGLGMSIVQRIVAKLGGTLGVHSQPGVGSTFWFTLPAP